MKIAKSNGKNKVTQNYINAIQFDTELLQVHETQKKEIIPDGNNAR